MVMPRGSICISFSVEFTYAFAEEFAALPYVPRSPPILANVHNAANLARLRILLTLNYILPLVRICITLHAHHHLLLLV